MINMVSDWLRKHTYRLVTPQCHLCRLDISPTATHLKWCDHCAHYFTPQPRCQRCGLETLINVEACGQCLASPPPWHRLYCVGDYRYPLSNYVHQMKFSHQFWYARDLAQLLVKSIEQSPPLGLKQPSLPEIPSLITSVPLHWSRYIKRGFNQSDLLARYTAQQLGCQHLQLFKREFATQTQKGLNKAKRQKNVANAFRFHSANAQKYKINSHSHVAIIDDVVTTGSTVYQLCQLLLEVGVKRIDIYCICRTPEPNK